MESPSKKKKTIVALVSLIVGLNLGIFAILHYHNQVEPFSLDKIHFSPADEKLIQDYLNKYTDGKASAAMMENQTEILKKFIRNIQRINSNQVERALLDDDLSTSTILAFLDNGPISREYATDHESELCLIENWYILPYHLDPKYMLKLLCVMELTAQNLEDENAIFNIKVWQSILLTDYFSISGNKRLKSYTPKQIEKNKQYLRSPLEPPANPFLPIVDFIRSFDHNP